jgi:hypothetical protein
MRTQPMKCVLRSAETLVRLLREAVEAREACPHAATWEQVEKGQVRPEQTSVAYDRWWAEQSGARADALCLAAIREQFKVLVNSFAVAANGAAGLSVSQRVALARRLRETVKERRGRPRKNKKKAAFPAAYSGGGIPRGLRTREALARGVGLGSGYRLWLAGMVVDGGDAELIAAMDAGELSIEEAARRVRRREASRSRVAATPLPEAAP